jgi:hypothetical protein
MLEVEVIKCGAAWFGFGVECGSWLGVGAFSSSLLLGDD